MKIEACIWDKKRIKRLADPKTHTAADKEPEYALYIFNSSKPIIRAGAIGVARIFSIESGRYSENGNSVSRRFDQYNRKPEERPFKSGPNKGKCRNEVLPWSARPFIYIWGATLAGDVTPPILLAAESMMHQRLQRSGLSYQGSSCHKCANEALAIEVAENSLRIFLELAPRMFS